MIAKPAVNHLIEMRDGLFEQIVAHDSDKFIDELAPYFELVKQTRWKPRFRLPLRSIKDLLTMTPYAFRAQPARREALIDRCQQAGSMRFTTDFMIYGFQKFVLNQTGLFNKRADDAADAAVAVLAVATWVWGIWVVDKSL